MSHRINERNTGTWSNDSTAKKRSKLTNDDKVAVAKVLKAVYNAMEFDDVLNDYSDGGRVTLMLDPTEMASLRVMIAQLTGEQADRNDKF